MRYIIHNSFPSFIVDFFSEEELVGFMFVEAIGDTAVVHQLTIKNPSGLKSSLRLLKTLQLELEDIFRKAGLKEWAFSTSRPKRYWKLLGYEPKEVVYRRAIKNEITKEGAEKSGD